MSTQRNLPRALSKSDYQIRALRAAVRACLGFEGLKLIRDSALPQHLLQSLQPGRIGILLQLRQIAQGIRHGILGAV